jgi:hypothetical protein
VPASQKLRRYIAEAIYASQSMFDRLVFLGSLRNSYDGRYGHEGWSGVAVDSEIHSAVSDFHRSVFRFLLRLSVIELSKELRLHFRSNSCPENHAARIWLEIEPFRELIPQGCSPAMRELFISQIRTALELLLRSPDWSELDGPVASPRLQLDQSPLLRWLN